MLYIFAVLMNTPHLAVSYDKLYGFKEYNYIFWSETSLGWFGGERNGNVKLAIALTQRSLPESNSII